MDSALLEEAEKASSNLSFWQRLRLRLGKKIFIGEELHEGWNGYLPFYLFLCSVCGHYAKDYPHGFYPDEQLYCLFCGKGHIL